MPHKNLEKAREYHANRRKKRRENPEIVAEMATYQRSYRAAMTPEDKKNKKDSDNAYRLNNLEEIRLRKHKAAAKLKCLYDQLKMERGCYDCGGKGLPPEALDWDHMPGTIKSFNISVGIYKYSSDIVMGEISKCQVVCSNCHRVRTTKRKQERKGC